MQRSPADPNDGSGLGTFPGKSPKRAAEETVPPSAPTPPPGAESTAIVPVGEKKPEKKRKFNNGWTSSLEILVAEWADKANCYRWMHDRAAASFGSSNFYMTLPVIVLSTVTGTASFGINGLLPDDGAYAKYAGAAIGVVSLLTALIQTVSNTLRYAQQSEAHRVAAISWGKFQRFVSIELSLHPDERMDAMNFLKMARVELDRLIEQSPSIPPTIVRAFEFEFRKNTNIKRPEIAGGVEHTRVFDDRDARMIRLASEAALMLSHKKKFLQEMVLGDLDKRIAQKTLEQRAELETVLRAEAEKAAFNAVGNIKLTNSLRDSPNSPSNTITLDIQESIKPASIELVATPPPPPRPPSRPPSTTKEKTSDSPPPLLTVEEDKI
jgi:hypothetical protein